MLWLISPSQDFIQQRWVCIFVLSLAGEKQHDLYPVPCKLEGTDCGMGDIVVPHILMVQWFHFRERPKDTTWYSWSHCVVSCHRAWKPWICEVEQSNCTASQMHLTIWPWGLLGARPLDRTPGCIIFQKSPNQSIDIRNVSQPTVFFLLVFA